MKWGLIAVGIVIGLPVLLYFGASAYYAVVGNAHVAEELKREPEGGRAKRVMLLLLPDGREFPVNYLREGNQVFVGADGRWWRLFRGGNATVQVHIQGNRYSGTARVVLNDPEYQQTVFARLRPKAPAWLPNWLNGKLIVIDLDS